MSDINRGGSTAGTGTTGTSTRGGSAGTTGMSSSSSGSGSGSGIGSGNQGFTDNARQKALDAYDTARGTASDASRRASETIEESPMIALAAGMAAGALVAAILPVTRQERQMMGPVGSRVTDAAREAAQTARRVAPDKLRELGLTPNALAEKAKEAATDTAQAAGRKFRNEATG